MVKLGKDVFVALASVGWADGAVAAEEAEALRHAARACGVEGADLEAVERATQAKVELADVRKLKLSPRERLFVYAMATWLARVDGVVMPEEKMLLLRLGNLLALADGDRTKASAAAFAIEQLGDHERPPRFDLAGLAARLESALAPSIPPGMA